MSESIDSGVRELLELLQSRPEAKQLIGTIRAKLFSKLHEMVFFGKGGYDFSTVYNLPIWLRNYIYQEILEYYRKEAEEVKNDGHQTLNNDGVGMPEQVRQKIQASRKKPDFSIKTKQ